MYKLILTTIFVFIGSTAFAQSSDSVSGGTTTPNITESPKPASPAASTMGTIITVTLPAEDSNGAKDGYKHQKVTISGEMKDYSWEMDLDLNYVSTEGPRMEKPNDLKVMGTRCKAKSTAASSTAPALNATKSTPSGKDKVEICTLIGHQAEETSSTNEAKIILHLSQFNKDSGSCSTVASRRINLRAICN